MFVTKVYAKEQERTGNAYDNFRLARVKERQSFTCNAPVRVYLVQTNNLKELLQYKRDIRKKFILDCLHIPDTHMESVSLAKLVFSNTLLNLLSDAKIE